jgi:hypothetical protein
LTGEGGVLGVREGFLLFEFGTPGFEVDGVFWFVVDA